MAITAFKKTGTQGLVAGVALASFFCAHAAFAATLSVSSASSAVRVGDTVVVKVLVNAGGQAINTAEGTLQFPSDLLQAVSISKSSSIFSIWVEEPSFSNQTGKVSFSGGLPSPGYQGNGGTVLSVSFRAKRAGTAAFSLANATVRANDGLGTNVLTSAGGLQLAVASAPAATPVKLSESVVSVPTSVIGTAPVGTTTTISTIAVAATPMPILNAMPQRMSAGSPVLLSGQASQRIAQVYLYAAKDGNAPVVLKTAPDASGTFLVLGPTLEDGVYEIWAQGVSADGVPSQPTERMRITVGDQPFITVGSIPLSTSSLIAFLAALSLFASIMAIWGWYKVYRHRKAAAGKPPHHPPYPYP